MSDVMPMQFSPTLPPEEVARANFYGLLARLFYAPPDAALLEAIAGAAQPGPDEGEDAIGAAWHELAQAAARADPEEVREEYETVFIGTGKAAVTLYTSAYTMRFTNEVPLVALRAKLAELGLGRHDQVHEPEDHIAALCDVMRHLVAEQKRNLNEQQVFFTQWIAPTVQPLCAAIRKHEMTKFYKAVARFAETFFDIEQTAFEML